MTTTNERERANRPVYVNESFWWSSPIQENYIGLDRGTAPAPAPLEPQPVPAARRSLRLVRQG